MGASLCWTPVPSAQPQSPQAGSHQTCHVGGVAPLSTRALRCLFRLKPMVLRSLGSWQAWKGQA